MTTTSTEIYLDNNASTPLDPRVAQALNQFYRSGGGNASSAHRRGRVLSHQVSMARQQIFQAVGATNSRVIFTSGATEANNLALQGFCSGSNKHRRFLLISAVEHSSVDKVASFLEKTGRVKVRRIPVTKGGRVDLNVVGEMITPPIQMVSVMAANSETGVINPVSEIARICQDRGVIFHCDMTQALGRIEITNLDFQPDLISLSGHKIYGPGGVGALVVKRSIASQLEPILWGGGQEMGLRSGSLNVGGIIGMGLAAQIAGEQWAQDAETMSTMRDWLVDSLVESVGGVYENGDTTHRLPNTVNLYVEGVDAEALIAGVDPVCISTGSACSVGSIEPSHVLTAMGIPPEQAFSSVRISLGRFTTESEVERASEIMQSTITRIRRLSQMQIAA